MQLSVHIQGLDKVDKMLKRAPKVLEDFAVIGGKEIAEISLLTLKGHIDKQDLPWKKLSENWKLYKVNHGLSEKIYESTLEFKNKLTIRKDGKRNVYRVGAFDDMSHGNSGLSMHKLATILEYGNELVGIPARPLFRPTQLEVKGIMRKHIKDIKKKLARQIVKGRQ